jgi:acyl-coenzyme A synthetase/AMP-(fatty) acid ligase
MLDFRESAINSKSLLWGFRLQPPCINNFGSVYACFLYQVVFNYQPGDVFGCVADIGWITGHSYVVYGPLINGATTVLFESTPTHPDPGRQG